MTAVAVGQRIDLDRMFECLDCCVNVGPGCGPNRHAPFVSVELRHSPFELRRLARAHNHDAAELQGRVIGKFLAELVQLEHLGLSDRRRDRERGVHSDEKVSLLADFFEEAQLLLRCAHCLYAGDAQPVRFANGRTQGRKLCGARRLRQLPCNQINGVVLEHARRLSRAAIFYNDPRPWTWRLTSDAGKLEGSRIGPGNIPMLARHEDRPVLHRFVEDRARGRIGGGQKVVVPVTGEEPGRRDVVLGVIPKFSFEVVDRPCRSKIEMPESKGTGHQFQVRIVEPGQHRRAMGVENDGLGTPEALDVAIRSDPQNLVAANGDGFLKIGAAAPIHLAVDDDQIDRTVRIFSLCADDEAGNERGSDNDRHDDGREARRHFCGYSVASRALLEEGEV